MSLDGLSMCPLASEIDRAISGGRIDKINQPNKQSIILSVRQPGQTLLLHISINPQNPAVHIIEKAPDNPPEPPMFCMVLRKHIETARIASVTQHGLDRILIITMDVQFGVISLAVLALVTFLRFLPGKYRLLVFILLIIIVLLAVWFWPGHSGGLWELHEVLHGRTQLSFGSNRLAVWYYSLLLSGESLLTGGGSGTFRTRFNEFLLKNDLKIPTEQDGKALPDYFDTPHNEYISQLTDHGLPALILFVLLLLLSVFRKRDGLLPLLTPCSAAVLCYAVQAFFAFSVCIVAPMFWILIALSFGE